VPLPRLLICAALAWLSGRALAVGSPGREPAQGAPKSSSAQTVWDGVYTTEQAERGKALYAQSCAACHSADLRGDGTSPSLIEEGFAFQWNDASVGELYEQIRKLMPSNRPNSLPPQTYRDIVAFILHANKFPAGGKELDVDLDALERIRITAKHP
jgi:quinoprotein glucose dehydrogenase